MEIEAAEVAGDVDDFADEKEAGHFAAFHGFAGEFVGVDAAGGHFGFFVAFRVGRNDDPFVQIAFEPVQCFVGPRGRGVYVEPALGKAFRKNANEGVASGGDVSGLSFANGLPLSQYEEICRMAGPLRPRCVKSICSRKEW